MVEGEVIKVALVDGEERKAVELNQLEQLASRLMEVEKLFEECRVKLSQAEAELEEYRRKSDVERRFSEVAGIPYVDKAPELEERVKSLKTQLENLSGERVKIRSEILLGLSNAIVPVEADGRSEASEEVFFNFRNGVKCPAITNFIKKELKFGLPPVYVALTPEGLKVVGVNDKTSAIKEVIKAVEELRAKAAKASSELKQSMPESLGIEPAEEQTAVKGMFSPFKKLGKRS